jgi:thioredoxin-related protein
MTKKLTILILAASFLFSSAWVILAGTPAKKEFSWVSYDKGLEAAKKEKKHVIVDFYTTWCGWCKKMDKDTYENTEVKKLLSENYIAVKLNAESSKALSLNGKTLTERQVAQEFKVTGFPTTCFLKPDGEKIACLPGYAGPDHFANILSYIKDKAYEKDMRLDDYIKEKQQKKSKN